MAQATDPVTGRPATPPTDTTRASDRPAAIADDIRETRAEMSETLDAIGAKLDPSHIADQAKEALTTHARDAGASLMDAVKDSSVLDTIKANPLPAAAVGLSLAWFVSKLGESESERYRRDRYNATGDPYYAPRYFEGGGYRPYPGRYDGGQDPRGYGDGSLASRQRPAPSGPGSGTYTDPASGGDGGLLDKAADALDTAKDKAADLAGDAKDAVTDAASAARDTATDLADAARDHASSAADHASGSAHRTARRAESWLDRQMQSNPLAVGAVALAAGALVGLSIPETDAEHELMGEHADAAKAKALRLAESKADSVQAAAEDLGEEASAKVREVADTVKTKADTVSDKAATKAKEVAGKAKAEAKKTASAAKAEAKESTGTKADASGANTGSTKAPTGSKAAGTSAAGSSGKNPMGKGA